MKVTSKYFSALPILSYNAVFMFINSNRGYGKTWALKRRAFRRAEKHGKKTIWLRRFKKEVKECAETFYASKDLREYIGTMGLYDAETKRGNMKQQGRTFYIKRGNKWTWFLKIYSLSDANAARSADDVDCDTIIFDEYTTTPEKYRRYRGNEVTDLIDLFYSAKREHKLQVFFLGNKEGYENPYFSYFGIKTLPEEYEGIRTYRNGSIAVQQINNKPVERTDYDRKVKDLFKGTAYGDYIYNSEYKVKTGLKPRKMPSNAAVYIQLNWNNVPLKVGLYNGFFYVNGHIDITQPVYTDKPLHKYKKEFLLVKRQKRFFTALINAISDSRIYYESEAIYEAATQFYKWLSI